MKQNSLHQENGIYISAATKERFSAFETNYLKVREKEKRILTTEDIRLLPYPAENSPDYKLWELRRKNILRFLSYLATRKKSRILDVGCGNGFFTHLLSKEGHEVVGLDVNLTELQQAASAFSTSKIRWYYLDLLNETLPEEQFDLITFCSSFHYFSDPTLVLKKCKTLLRQGGEVHIIDSPFYTDKTRDNARERSRTYFQSLDAEAMSDHYHHNTHDFLKNFEHTFKYKPNRFLSKILRIRDSPFPWVSVHFPVR